MNDDYKFLDKAIRHPEMLTPDGALRLFDCVQSLRTRLAASEAERDALVGVVKEQREEASRFYNADGTYEVLSPEEVKRQRVACAGALEAARECVKELNDGNDHTCNEIEDDACANETCQYHRQWNKIEALEKALADIALHPAEKPQGESK